MKQLIVISLLLLGGGFCRAQLLEPADWRYYPSQEEVRIGQEVDLFFDASLQAHWYLYATGIDPALGPMPAQFTFEPHPSYALVGEIVSVRPEVKFDPAWQGEVRIFEGEALFRQRVRILAENPRIEGRQLYQLCSREDGRCIIGEARFSFGPLKVVPARVEQQPQSAPAPAGRGRRKALPPDLRRAADGPIDPAEAGRLEERDISQRKAEPEKKEGAGEQGSTKASLPEPEEEAGSLWGFALLAFGAGLAALLTPCVFPLIPLTVSYFSFQRREGGRGQGWGQPLLYGASIIGLYTGAGTFLAWLNGPAFAHWLSTHWLPNLFFFGVFTLFALSFLGLFELRLPSAWINGADRRAVKGGWTGIFFMAFTLVLVSFSCTGPIVGALLVASAGGEVLLPVVGMLAFSLAFALPFSLLAFFPEGLRKLPRSGSWLNSVKVVLGFVELALGLKFLSVADQVYHWGLLDRPLYLALWIGLFSLAGLYLLGRLRLAGLEQPEAIGIPRLLLALAFFSFVLYLLPGLFGAPLPALAGYLPPRETGRLLLRGEAGERSAGGKEEAAGLCGPPRYGELLDWPLGLSGYFELEQALACARAQGKPLFIAFTGHGCVNCREMEARVWSRPAVRERLAEDFVLLALYVDERTELPEAEWYRSEVDGRLKKTLGSQQADYQIRRFGTNAQPYYVLLDPYSGKSLGEPVAYEPDPARFLEFLEEGSRRFQARVEGRGGIL